MFEIKNNGVSLGEWSDKKIDWWGPDDKAHFDHFHLTLTGN